MCYVRVRSSLFTALQLLPVRTLAQTLTGAIPPGCRKVSGAPTSVCRPVMVSRMQDRGSLPVKLEIIDVEKRKGLSKYYAYLIAVTCKDNSRYVIYRRYSDFHEMHSHLEERFPIEAGAISAKDRTLPTLPGKIFLGRSAVREVTDKRCPLLNSYLKKLCELPDKIRYDSIVLAFVRPTAEDKKTHFGTQSNGAITNPGRPPAKPEKPAKPPTRPVTTSLQLPVPHFHVQTKRTPPPPRKAPPPRPSVPKLTKGPKAKTLYAYTGQYSDELSFPAGITLTLVKRVDAEWWEGRVDGRTGLVPGNYIEVIEEPVARDNQDTLQESDEWSEDSDEEKGKITYYFRGAARTMEVDLGLLEEPSLLPLQWAIQKHLHQKDIALNYKDLSGDLIEMTSNEDVELMMSEGIPPQKRSNGTHAPWAIYVTVAGDHTPYNTNPYK